MRTLVWEWLKALSTGKEVILILKNCWGGGIQTMFLATLAEEGIGGIGEGGILTKLFYFHFKCLKFNSIRILNPGILVDFQVYFTGENLFIRVGYHLKMI